MTEQENADLIRNTHTITMFQVGHKLEGNEMLYLFLDTRGTEYLGYMTSLDLWFMESGGSMKYYETLFETDIFTSDRRASYRQAYEKAAEKMRSEGGWVVDN